MTFYSRRFRIPFEEVLNKVIQNLKSQGFAIISNIDLQETFKQKLKVEFRHYKILGACNPLFAYRAVSLESHAGALLPCNIVIQEHENGEVEVSAVNPLESMNNGSKTTGLKDLSTEIGIRLRASIDYIQKEIASKECDVVNEKKGNYSCFIPG